MLHYARRAFKNPFATVRSCQTLTLARHFQGSLRFQAKAPVELLGLASLESENDHALARRWIKDFEPFDIPSDAWSASYSRSSGPGGQHVNKTNSRATLKLPLSPTNTSHWLPPFLHSPLSHSPHYTKSTRTLQISSQSTRSASQNLQSALNILYEEIISAAKSVIVGETSLETKERVKESVEVEKRRIRVEKGFRSRKKADRRGD